METFVIKMEIEMPYGRHMRIQQRVNVADDHYTKAIVAGAISQAASKLQEAWDNAIRESKQEQD